MLEPEDLNEIASHIQQHWGAEYHERRPVLLGGLPATLVSSLPGRRRVSDQISSDVRTLAQREDAQARPAIVILLEGLQKDPGRPEVARLRGWIRQALRRPIDDQIDQAARALDQARRTGAPFEAHRESLLELKRRRRAPRGVTAGDRLNDRYELQAELGEGGFATVWRAWDPKAASEVAVKVLHAQHGRDASRVERFRRGARALVRLTHTHIVRVLDAEGEDDGHHFFVQTLLEGGDLQRNPPPRSHVWALLAPLARALGYAHRQKVVHRDIKPANILLDSAGLAVLVDFDLVVMPDTTGGTRSGLGTFGFQAPEALRNAATVGPQADVYGLGMTALYLLSVGTVQPARLIDPAVRRSKCEQVGGSAAEQALLMRALEEEPEQRFRDGDALAAAMERLASGEAEQALRPTLVRVEAGRLSGRSDKEPRLSEALLVAETHVTQGQFEVLMGYNPSEFGGDPERPVESVSLREAKEYCNRLSAEEGFNPCYRESTGEEGDEGIDQWPGNGYRLLMTQEWRYLAHGGRGGSPQPPDPDDAVWWAGNSGGETRPVGQKAPNPLRLRDILGNVATWVTPPGGHMGRSIGPHFASPLSEVTMSVEAYPRDSWEYMGTPEPELENPKPASTTGFRVVRRAPTPIDDLPCPPDQATYLLWYRKGIGYETLWLGVDGPRQRLKELGRWPNLVMVGGREAWLLHEREAWGTRWADMDLNQLVATYDRGWFLVGGRTAEEHTLMALGTGEAMSWAVRTHLTILGGVGPYLFLHTRDHWAGGTDMWSADFEVLDLSVRPFKRAEGQLLSAGPPPEHWHPRAEATALGEGQEHYSDEGDPQPDEHFHWEPEATAVLPRFSSDGKLELAWQYTHGTFGAASDGSWHRYYASVRLDHPELPPLLQPWAQAPPAVCAYLKHRPDQFLGWTVVPDDTDGFHAFLREVFKPSGY
jgi:serine/threonine protein kinase